MCPPYFRTLTQVRPYENIENYTWDTTLGHGSPKFVPQNIPFLEPEEGKPKKRAKGRKVSLSASSPCRPVPPRLGFSSCCLTWQLLYAEVRVPLV